MIVCIILIVALIAATPYFLKWIMPLITYLKIGSYADYKPISKSLDNKETEYRWYQVAGFKNIGSDGIKCLQSVSKCYNKNDLEWLKQCSTFLEKGIKETGIDGFSLPENMEDADFLQTYLAIKRSRTPLVEKYQGKLGCSTCGEAGVMMALIDVRINSIELGKEILPGLYDAFIDAVNEVKNPS